MAVGGVTIENFGGFIKAGAASAGIGGELVNKKLVEANDFKTITERAASFIKAFQDAVQSA